MPIDSELSTARVEELPKGCSKHYEAKRLPEKRYSEVLLLEIAFTAIAVESL